MGTTTTSRVIAASVEDVFDCVAHIERFREAVPHIVDVTEYGPPRSVRLVSDMDAVKAYCEREAGDESRRNRVTIASACCSMIAASLGTMPTNASASGALAWSSDAAPIMRW